MDLVFGPVPSRRLGRSLGINNILGMEGIPGKICTYACVYCQLGRTARMTVEREITYDPAVLIDAARARVAQAARHDEPIDYLTVVPDGEPTLDRHLDRLLDGLRPLGPRLAVITNSALIDDPAVRDALCRADWVSLKVDAAREATWRQIDRPHGRLSLSAILAGADAFAAAFEGTLVTETMLVADLNDGDADLEATARTVSALNPRIAYLSVPTRPPAEPWVHPPTDERLSRAYQLFDAHLPRVEYLLGYEGNAFAATGDAEDDLLSITAVHPMREDAVATLLEKDGASWSLIDAMVAREQLVEIPQSDHRYYLRRIERSR
jgi:wyosine [tRNA(Phe)-imidazoG37] synthetase (radical SAM superfamily)